MAKAKKKKTSPKAAKTIVKTKWQVIKKSVYYNYVDNEGNLLSSRWFTRAYDFRNGYGLVQFNKRWNHIGENGKFLSDEWWDMARTFWDGFAFVNSNNRWNCVNKKGQLMYKQGFDAIDKFTNGFCRVVLENRWNWIGYDGKLMTEYWWDYCGNFNNKGIADCGLGGEVFYMKNDGVVFKEKKPEKKAMPTANTRKLRDTLYMIFVQPEEIGYALINEYTLGHNIYLTTGQNNHGDTIATVYFSDGKNTQIIAETNVVYLQNAAKDLNSKIDLYLQNLDELYDFYGFDRKNVSNETSKTNTTPAPTRQYDYNAHDDDLPF